MILKANRKDRNTSDMELSGKSPKIFTVSQLTTRIKAFLEEEFDFIWLEGEISNFASPSSGHYYMTLKDKHARIKAVMFKMETYHLRFRPENGMNVIARGRIGVYEPRGEYQIIIDYLEPLGIGALAAAFEQVKKKLSLEGVFDEKRKKPVPFFVKKIAVITSPTGAAIQDFLRISLRRMPNLEITVIPVSVQGDKAAGEIVEAFDIANKELDSDVIVLTRGGGSLEDLLPFNREEVAYAIKRSIIPVVSAVGHEVDLTISDLAADLRAPTPSGAAELVVREKETLNRDLRNLSSRLEMAMYGLTNRSRDRVNNLFSRIKDPKRKLADAWLRLDEIQNRLLKTGKKCIDDKFRQADAADDTLILNSPLHKISMLSQKSTFLARSLSQTVTARLNRNKRDIQSLSDRLNSLNPLSVLKRGYSITRQLPKMRIVKDSSQVNAGDRINILLGTGTLDCLVENTGNED